MGPLRKTVATLRITGDDLDPEQISIQLGCTPTRARRKGDVVLVSKKTGATRVFPTGMWSLHSTDREPGNLEAQVEEILSQVTSDLDVWRDLSKRYHIDLFCGLFMGGGNEAEIVSPSALAALGQRGIELQLDIYGPPRDIMTG